MQKAHKKTSEQDSANLSWKHQNNHHQDERLLIQSGSITEKPEPQNIGGETPATKVRRPKPLENSENPSPG